MKLAVLALFAATPAVADTITLVPTCVESESDDRMLLVRALEKRELLVVESGCSETIKETRVDGVVRLESARRNVQDAIEPEMGAVYARMLAAMFEPERAEEEPMPQVAGSYEPPPAEPAPTIANTIWYGRLGLGSGTTVYGGFRVGRSAVFDLSVAMASERVAVRAQVLRTSSPKDAHSMYWGGGIGFATISDQVMVSNSETESEGGAQLEATVGVELRRTSTVRWYIEANGTVPLYDYPATAVFSFGFGK